MKKRFALNLLVSLAFQFFNILFFISSAIAEDIEFYMEANGGVSATGWEPGFGEYLLNIDTEGLQAKTASFEFGYARRPLFSYYEAGPIDDNSPEQQEMFETNSKRVVTLEKSRLGVVLSPIADILDIDSKLARFLLSARMIKTTELYFGTATSNSDFVYVSEDHRIIDNGSSYSFPDSNLIDSDEQVIFRTTFDDVEYSFGFEGASPCHFLQLIEGVTLFRVNTHCGRSDADGIIRIGYYETEWSRPASSNSIVSGSLTPIVFDTKFKSSGIMLSYEVSNDDNSAYFKIKTRYGTSNDISTKISSVSEELLFTDYKLEYYSFELSGGGTAHWDKVLGSMGLSIGIDISWEIRQWSVGDIKYSNGVQSQYSIPIDADLLYYGAITFGLNWI